MCILFASSKAKNVKTLNIEGWEYSYNRDSQEIFNIVPDPETRKWNPRPRTFFKYYGMSKNSVDALTGLYVYASHPNQLNDPLDCDAKIVRIDSREDVDALFENDLVESVYEKTKSGNGGYIEKFKKVDINEIDYSALDFSPYKTEEEITNVFFRHYFIVLKEGYIPPEYITKENE